MAKKETKKEQKLRTETQNRALWLYFTMLADALNDAGFSIKKTLTFYKADIDWDKDSLHDLMWVPIQKALLGKGSTTELKSQEDIDRVYEHVNRFTADKMGISMPFPNKEEMMDRLEAEERRKDGQEK